MLDFAVIKGRSIRLPFCDKVPPGSVSGMASQAKKEVTGRGTSRRKAKAALRPVGVATFSIYRNNAIN